MVGSDWQSLYSPAMFSPYSKFDLGRLNFKRLSTFSLSLAMTTTAIVHAQSISTSAGVPELTLPADMPLGQTLESIGPLASLSLIESPDGRSLNVSQPAVDLHPHLSGELGAQSVSLQFDNPAQPDLETLEGDEAIPEASPVNLVLAAILSGEMPWPEAIPADQREDLQRLYQAREARALWHAGGIWNDDLDAALYQVETAHLDGLDPADYSFEPALDFAKAQSPMEIAEADMLITVALLPYVNHMSNGRHARRPRFDARELLNQDFDSDNSLSVFMNSLVPEVVEYQRLRTMLATLRETREEAVEIPLFSEGGYLRLGDEGERVAELRHILTLTQDYSPNPELESAEDFNPALFDDSLNAAVLAFQERKGLSADGIVGRGTREALNDRAANPIALIKVNMERLRWEAPLNGEERYVRVNIPGYRLHVREGEELAMDMRAIVGRNDRQTPIMSDRIVNLKFSPDWTVPSTIYREDILPQLRANPGYAAASGYSVVTSGGRVNASTVDWSNPPPVTIYKAASANGPLGGVRFSLTNSIGIFLHDTNRKSLFSRGRRNLSSGCVRVGDPAGLAHYLVQDDGWSLEQVQGAMNRGRISWKDVDDSEGVRVYLSYLTAFVDEEGELQTTRDPYRKDRQLLALFDES